MSAPPLDAQEIRVLHVSRFFHPHVGGTENFIAQLAEALAPYGVRSTVLASERHVDENGPAPAIPVERLPAIGPDRAPIPYARLGRATKLLGSADIVHAHDLRFLFELAASVTALRHVPLVLSSHGLIFHTQRLARVKAAAWHGYYRLLLRRCAVVLCGSAHDLAACQRIGLDRAELWANPVRTTPFENLRPSPEDGALLYFGRIAPNKGLERLREVLDRAPASWRLTIVGHGEDSYVEGLRTLFDPLGARVNFAGALPDSALAETIRRHACVVLPSVAEGFGLTLVEAMAAGVPVVASDIPPYREIAGDSPVRLVDFAHPAEAVAAIGSAVAGWDPAVARARASEFSWSRHAGELAERYRGLVHA